MAKNRYYYYDPEACAFVEHKPRRRYYVGHAVAFLTVTMALSLTLAWGMDMMQESPEEWKLREENMALQGQLSTVLSRMDALALQIDDLSEKDRELYRTLLQGEPVSEDVLQAGIGGTDAYEQFDRFSEDASTLLRATAGRIDQLERQVNLQNTNYRELVTMAEQNKLRMAQMPAILPADGPLVSGYGMRRHPILRVRRMHHGIDMLVPKGSEVVATGDGVIKDKGYSSGYGNFVKVEHPATGYVTLYGHLSRIPRHIRKGRPVKRGEVIAYSGNTGLSTAPHLHYEVRGVDGKTYNPIQFFAPNMTPHEYKRLLEASENNAASLD